MLYEFHSPAPVGSGNNPPMAAHEIDEHPDSKRIWATIEAVRNTTNPQIEELEIAIRELNSEIDALEEELYDWENQVAAE